MAPWGRRNKYGVAPVADRTDADGVVHASKAQMIRWQKLQQWQQLGHIKNLRREVAYPLHAGDPPVKICSYIADHVFEDAEGRIQVEDVKGVLTPEFKLKRKLMRAEYGIEIVLIGKTGSVSTIVHPR
jgi:hypothetical protein